MEYFNPNVYFQQENKPNWAPNGEYLIFESSRHFGDDFEICTARPDGSMLNCLTKNDAYNGAPDWWMPLEN